MKHSFIRFIFIFLLGLTSSCVIMGASSAGRGIRLANGKGAAKLAQQLCDSAGAAAARLLPDKRSHVPLGSSARLTPKVSLGGAAFNTHSASHGQSSAPSRQSSLHEDTGSRHSAPKVPKQILFRSQAQAVRNVSTESTPEVAVATASSPSSSNEESFSITRRINEEGWKIYNWLYGSNKKKTPAAHQPAQTAATFQSPAPQGVDCAAARAAASVPAAAPTPSGTKKQSPWQRFLKMPGAAQSARQIPSAQTHREPSSLPSTHTPSKKTTPTQPAAPASAAQAATASVLPAASTQAVHTAPNKALKRYSSSKNKFTDAQTRTLLKKQGAVFMPEPSLSASPSKKLPNKVKHKKELVQPVARTESLPRSPSAAYASTPQAASAAPAVGGLKKNMPQTQPAQPSKATIPAAVKAAVTTAHQAPEQPTHALVVMPAAAAFKSTSPNIKHTLKMSEQVAQLLADIFKKSQAVPGGQTALTKAFVIQPLNQLGKLSKSVAQQKLKLCIVGEDYIRKLMELDQVGESVITDPHNKILGVIGKRTAQGYRSCLFDESIVTKMAQMVTAPGSTGKVEAVYRPSMQGKSVVKQIRYNEKPDIFVLLTKNDHTLRSNIAEIFKALSGSFVDPQSVSNLPSIAIVCSGNAVPQFQDLMHKGNMLNAPRSAVAPLHVQADILQPAPVIEADVQAQGMQSPQSEKVEGLKKGTQSAEQMHMRETDTPTFEQAQEVRSKPEMPKRTAPKAPTKAHAAAPQAEAQAVPPVQTHNMQSPQSEKVEGLKRGAQSAEQGIKKTAEQAKVERSKPSMPTRAAVDQTKFNQDNGHTTGVKTRPRSGRRTMHRPSPQVPSNGGDDLFDFYKMFDEGSESPAMNKESQHSQASGGGHRDPVFPETYPEIHRNRPAPEKKDAAAAHKPAQKNHSDVQPVTTDTADDNDTSSSPRGNYERDDNSYHPGYDQVGADTAKDAHMPAKPTEQSRVPRSAQRDAPAFAVPHKGGAFGTPITGGAAVAQGSSMKLYDTKLPKDKNAYGMPLIEEGKKKIKQPDNQSLFKMNQAKKNNEVMPLLTAQEAVATTLPVSAAPTTVGILSIIGMILTIIASAVLRMLFAPFRLF